jgi:hypothetical protein
MPEHLSNQKEYRNRHPEQWHVAGENGFEPAKYLIILFY